MAWLGHPACDLDDAGEADAVQVEAGLGASASAGDGGALLQVWCRLPVFFCAPPLSGFFTQCVLCFLPGFRFAFYPCAFRPFVCKLLDNRPPMRSQSWPRKMDGFFCFCAAKPLRLASDIHRALLPRALPFSGAALSSQSPPRPPIVMGAQHPPPIESDQKQAVNRMMTSQMATGLLCAENKCFRGRWDTFEHPSHLAKLQSDFFLKVTITANQTRII